MTTERLAERAARMLAAYQRIAAKMYTLDAHAGRRFLKDERLRGVTADIARRVMTDANVLWSRFDELRRLSDQIPADTAGLGQTARAKLEALLGTDCVKLDAAGVPALISGDPVDTEVSLSVFAESIETGCAGVLEECAAVDAACGRVADAAAAVTAALDDAFAQAEELGMSGNATLTELRDRRTSVLNAALSDPVAMAEQDGGSHDRLGGDARRADSSADGPGGGSPLAGLSREVEEFRRRLAALDAVARDFPARLSALRDELATLAAAEERAAETCQLAASKILAPAPPRFTPSAETLTRALRDLEQQAAQSDRHSLAARLSDLATRIEEARRQCRRVDDSASALLDRRTELRGRLAAYSRKAARIGVIEDPRVAASAETARQLLALAPCDLRSATSAVRQFQQEISGAQEAPA